MKLKLSASTQSGCCLRQRWRAWRQLSTEAGKWVKEGVKLPWRCNPRPSKRKQRELSELEQEFLDKEVKRMLEMGAIAPSDRNDLVLSSIYTVPKKGSTKRRPVINLRWVNSHLHQVHFKMSTMKDVKQALTPGCYMAKIDLTDCFWGLPVAEQDQRTLAFAWKGQKYVFKCLPFGLALSPMFITKLYRKVIERLQADGHRVIIYIDDMLILGDSKERCEESLRATLRLMTDLGALVNEEKSSFCPAQVLEYLGFSLDSSKMTITAPANKILNLKKQIRSTLNHKQVSAREIASLQGKLNSMADALFPVRIHAHHIQAFRLALLAKGKGWDFKQELSTQAIQDMTWWLNNIDKLNGRPIIPPTPDVQATTDASDWGWGASMKKINETSSQSWGGAFSREDSKRHINYKELLAIYFLLRSAPFPLKGLTIDVGVDNTTALHYVRYYGGRKEELSNLAAMIHEFLKVNHINLTAYHIPGAMNHIADWESRRNNDGTVNLVDYQLNPEVFQRVDKAFGPHSMDMFATHQDKQLPRFGSWSPQPDAQWVDSMSHSWEGENPWINPPFSMIGRILQKMKKEKTTGTIVAPLWTAQPWYPTLLKMSVAPPLLLPFRRDLFVHPRGGDRLPRWASLAWRVSGRLSHNEGYQGKRSPQWRRRGNQVLSRITSIIGRDGLLSPEMRSKIHSLATTWVSLHG